MGLAAEFRALPYAVAFDGVDREHSKRAIGRIVGVSRGTVDWALESDRESKYQLAAGGSSFDAFAPRVRELLAKTPTMPAATLAVVHVEPDELGADQVRRVD